MKDRLLAVLLWACFGWLVGLVLYAALAGAGENTMPGERPIARLAGAALSAKCLALGPTAACNVSQAQIVADGRVGQFQATDYGTGVPVQCIGRRATGSLANPTAPGNGIALSQVGASMYDGTAFKVGLDAFMQFSVDDTGTVSATSHPSKIAESTTPDGSTTTAVCRTVDNGCNQKFTKLFTQYNGIATVSNGVPAEYAKIDTTGLTGNVASALLYAVPAAAAGMYRISSLVVETTAASVSSTLPNVQIVYTDNDVGSGTVTIDATPVLGVAGIGQTGALTANTVGTTATGVIVINAKASTNINYQTVNYASTAAGMAYAIHVKAEAL